MVAPSIRANMLWNVFGNAVFATSQWLVIVVIARSQGAETVGAYAYALALVSPVMAFAMLNMRTAQVTDQEDAYKLTTYVHLRLIALTVAAVCIVGFGLAQQGHSDISVVGLLLALTILKGLEALSDVAHGFLHRHEHMRPIAVSKSLRGTGQVLLLFVVVRATESLTAGLATMCAAAAFALAGDAYNSRRLRQRLALREGPALWASPEWRKLYRLAALCTPLGIGAFLDSLNANTPRYFIEAFRSRAELGHYAAIGHLLTGQAVFFMAVAEAVRPRLARYRLESTRAFWKLTTQLAAVAGLLSVAALIVALLFGGPLLAFVYGPEFAEETSLLVWMLAAGVPWNLAGVAGTALGAARRFRALMISFIGMTAVTAISGWFLVPSNGTLGAAWSLAAGMVCRLIISIVALVVGQSRT